MKSNISVLTLAPLLTLSLATLLTGCNGSSDSTQSSASCASVSSQRVALESRFLPADPATGSEPLKLLQGHIPRAVSLMADQGRLADSSSLAITVALELNHDDELEGKLASLYDPMSADFHRFMAPAEFRARYAPTDEQVAQVRAHLEQQGLATTSVSDNHFLIRAEGPVSALNAAFHTEIHQYQDAQGATYFSPAYDVQIPAGLPIQGIHGLHNVTRLHHYSNAVPANAASGSGASPRAATGPSGGFSPADIRKAYNIPSNLTGAGQTLAVFELDGYTASDIATYEDNFGLTHVPLKNVLVNGATGTPGGGVGEVTLDIELMTAIAPGASQILVYEGTNDDQGILATYAKIANDNLAQSVSTSWGTSEDGTSSSLMQSENNIFKQMAAQGQSIFAAAGDNGAYDDGTKLSVDDPGSQPYMVSVGGTRLATHSDGSYGSETTWNTDGKQADGAGGGGISTVWTIPSYQAGVATSQNKGSTTMRNTPDVALESDMQTGYSIYSSGAWGVWGGTSCAAPLWAAFTALVNQQRAANGLGTIGFMNPLLYQIGKSARYSSDFHDIQDGSTNIYYPAVTGYDNATGWGTFNASNLLQDLSATPAQLQSTVGSTNSCSSS